MEKLLIILLALIPVSQVQAQIFTEDGRYELFGKDDPDLFVAKGSPYLEDHFVPGTIFFEGKPALPVELRYNMYAQNFEIKVEQGKREIYTVDDWGKATYEMGGKKFISSQFEHKGKNPGGFFIVHFDGDQYKLLEKPEIKVTPPIRSDSGYSEDQPAKLKKISSFYILDSDGDVMDVRIKHRDIRKKFTSSASKKYLSDNRIREVEDLIAFLQYIDGGNNDF